MPSYLNTYSTSYFPLFCQIWPTVDDFMKDFKDSPILVPITDESAKLTYNLLIGRYYNSPIGYNSVGQWKLEMFTTMYLYGPTWEKRLEIQDKLRNLSEEEIIKGTVSMLNTAANPSTPITGAENKRTGTLADKELNYIKEQNVSLNERNKIDSYLRLNEALATDVTGPYLEKFKEYFQKCVAGDLTPTYIYEKEDY